MKLFDEDGHLNDTSFLLLQNDGGDDLHRLEISEHLSYCDDCLSRYLENLSHIELLTPMPSMVPNIRQNGKRLGAALFYRRFTVVAATFMAIMLWTTGAFSWQYQLMERDIRNGLPVEAHLINERNDSLGVKIADKVIQMLDQVQDWKSSEKKLKVKE